MGTLNMLVLAKRVNARILQASTSEVYGDPTVHPQSESYWGNVNPIGPRACYDEGKRVAETLMSDYHREDGVDIRIARIFNTYGPRMAENDGRVVSNFIVQALRGQELTLYGTGGQTRSFCYVDDLVDGLVRLMNADARHEPVNLGNPVEFTIRELAEEVAKVVGKDVQVTYRPLPQDDPTQRKPDITRARQWLGWEPTVPLAEGLVRTVEYFRRRLARRNRATAARLDPSEDLPSRQDGPI
jgi:UDP-glucuronate decarboxylase